MVSLLVASPVFDENVYATHSTSITNLQEGCKELGIHMDVAYGFHENARRELCQAFLNSDKYTHILLVDSDIEFNANDIIQMLLHNKSVVVGNYCKTKFRWDRVTEFINKKHDFTVTAEHLQNLAKESYYEDMIVAEQSQRSEGHLIEVPYAHDGIILIKREAFEMVRASDLETFMELWKTYGGKIYLDTTFRAKHWGKMGF